MSVKNGEVIMHSIEADDTEEIDITEMGNPAKPQGKYGEMMLDRMNESHSAVTEWGLSYLTVADDAKLLDIGCGGGATLAKLAGIVRSGKVYGIDYSDVSVRKSKEYNKDLVGSGRIEVLKGSVSDMMFEDGTFDGIVTVESFYFWPDPEESLKEVRRVLKDTGTFLLIADIYDTEELPDKAVENIRKYGLRNLKPEEFRDMFMKAGFSDVSVHLKDGTTWICVEGRGIETT